MLAHNALLKSTAILLLLAATAAAQSLDTLDLTRVTPAHARTGPGVPVTVPTIGGAAHLPREASALQLSVRSLDKANYNYGDPFIIHLVLRNTGRETVVIPWEPDLERVATGPGDAPRGSMLLSVLVQRSGENPVALPLAVLYGSKSRPMSVKALPPGGTVEIIADAAWSFPWYSQSSVIAPHVDTHALAVSARLGFLTGLDGRVYRDVESSNTVKIKLRKSAAE